MDDSFLQLLHSTLGDLKREIFELRNRMDKFSEKVVHLEAKSAIWGAVGGVIISALVSMVSAIIIHGLSKG